MSFNKFLNPKNDLCFKRIFGSEKNKDILIHFLNDIFMREHNPIQEVTYLKTAQEPEIAAQRTSIVDIMCKDQKGDRFIVEIQVAYEPGFAKRAQYYAAKAYIEQRGKDETYKDLKKITFLAITDFILFPEKPVYLSHHQMLDSQTYEHDLKDFSFSFLELPKFKKKKEELKTIIEKWAYFFKHADETRDTDLDSIIGDDYILKRAYEELDRYGWTPEELREYDSVDMKRFADQAILEGAFEEGLEKGKFEKSKEIAKRMLNKGIDPETIFLVTGINLENN